MKLLEALCQTPAVPGREHRMRRLVMERIKGLFDEVRVDAMGSVLAMRRPRPSKGRASKSKKPTKVMVAAHMDQIGFLVKHIDDKGFVRVVPVGGFDTRNLFARLVTVCPDPSDPRKDLVGVLNPSGKPVHIADDADKNKVPQIHEFTIDLGIAGDEVKKQVKIGDMVVLRAEWAQVGDTVVGQCMDNRVAVWIAIRAMEKVIKLGHDAELHIVFTVQEEVGLRGARTAAYAIKPDIGIGLDTTLCVDIPGVPDDMRTTRQGDGAAITCADSASIGDYDLIEQFEQIARKHKIKHQRSILARGGTDSGAIQPTGEGVRTITLSCPTRYIHTVTEMVHTTDLHACRDLLAAYLSEAR
jgi:putative aminopeptidase FrvX